MTPPLRLTPTPALPVTPAHPLPDPPPNPPALDPADAYQTFRRLVDPQRLEQQAPCPAQTVFTTFVTLWLLILQRLHGGASLEHAVGQLLFSFPDQDLPDCKRVRDDSVSGNSAAFSKARSRLDADLVSWLADEVFHALDAHSRPAFRGRRVLLLDGFTFSLAPTPQLRLAFPPASNQYGPSHWPVFEALTCHDLDSGLVCRPEYGPMYGDAAVAESLLACRLIPRLPGYAILLGDGNFGIFVVAYQATRGTHDVLFRLTQPRFEALRRQATPVGPGRWQVCWRPSKEEREKYGKDLPADAEVRGYLVEVQVDSPSKGAMTLYLFTTLQEGSNEELAQLYGRRWCVETDIRATKQTLGLGQVRGKSPEMVEKEVVLATVAYNLVVHTRRLAARQAQVPPRRLSFAGCRSLVEAFEAKVARGGLSAEELQRQFEKLLRACGQRKLPNRPGRQYPREVIPRRRRYPERQRCPADPAATPGAGAFDLPRQAAGAGGQPQGGPKQTQSNGAN